MLNEIVVPALYLLSGGSVLAAVNHLVGTKEPPRQRTDLLLGGMCLLMAVYGLCQIWALRAATMDQFRPALKWHAASACLFFILFPWFLTECADQKARTSTLALGMLFAVLFGAHLIQPGSLQYDFNASLEHLTLPWGEVLSVPGGCCDFRFEIGTIGALTAYLFSLHVLIAFYRTVRFRPALAMILAVLPPLAVSIAGLVGSSINRLEWLMTIANMAMVILFSLALRRKTGSPAPNPAWGSASDIAQIAMTRHDMPGDRLLIDNGLLPSMTQDHERETTEIPSRIDQTLPNRPFRDFQNSHGMCSHAGLFKEIDGRLLDVILKQEDEYPERLMEDTIHEIAAGVSKANGHTLFCQLVQRLGRLSGAEYAMLGVLKVANPQSMETLAVCAHGRIIENFSYGLKGTPCANVVTRINGIYPRNVRFQFPENRLLAELGAEGYIGVPMLGASGEPLGIMAVVTQKPIERSQAVCDLLAIFAARAAVEIERGRIEQSLQMATDELRATIELTPNVAVQRYDQTGRILFWNKASETLFGWRKEEAVGKTLDQLIQTADDTAAFLAICSVVRRTGIPTAPAEHTFRRRDGTQGTFISTLFALPDVNGQPRFIRMAVDISEHIQAKSEIRRMASQDSLTELANRTALREHMERLLTARHPDDHCCAMLLIDLDHFRTINDALGHNVGDDVLCSVARRLSESVCGRGFPARLGGDEFVVILEALPLDREEAAVAVGSFARKIADSLAMPIELGDRVFSIGVSIGVAMIHGADLTVSDVLRRADLALYRAKNLGRGNIQFFQPSLQAIADQRLYLERGLRSALAKHELDLYFQPQVTAFGQILGAEALLRCRHPDLGMISPSEFIPIAEETGLIHAIGAWVLHQTCSRLASWMREGTRFNGHLSVNLSPWQFACPDFVQTICGLIDEHGIEPAQLVLEITESILLHDIRDTTEKLTELRSAGFKVSLDDFGTGYSSLAYLKDLPLDILKIDKVFIDELAIESKFPLVETIIALGEKMNLSVIAEGIETVEQRDLLINLGCNGFQGYLFCQPLPEDQFIPWFLTNNPYHESRMPPT
ncbi:MAG: putative bifunctional diguanylate cyclase/phosphodiesterase [Gammaproteobacteria bacterium]